MAGTKGKETIVEGDEEMGGVKRVNSSDSDSVSRPEKRAKVEGETGGDGTKEEEELNDKVERLRELLADDPKKLSKKDVEEVINCLNVDEIVSLALKSDQGKGSDDGGGKWRENGDCRVKVLNTVRLMLGCMEGVNTGDVRLVYEKWPPKAVGMVLLAALDSFAFRMSRDPLKMVEYYDIIPKLCRVLPFKLLAHILDKKGLFWFSEEIDEEETRRVQKKAAEGCGFCSGKAEHTGTYGKVCTLMEAVPKGTAIPPGYSVECRLCGTRQFLYTDSFDGCFVCDWEVGRAFVQPVFPSRVQLIN